MTGMISGRVMGPAWIWTMENPASRTSRSKASTISRSWVLEPFDRPLHPEPEFLVVEDLRQVLGEFLDEAVHAVAQAASGAGLEEERVAALPDCENCGRNTHRPGALQIAVDVFEKPFDGGQSPGAGQTGDKDVVSDPGHVETEIDRLHRAVLADDGRGRLDLARA